MHAAQLLFPDFALILCGLLLCRFTPLNRGIWQPIENLVYFFLFPVLLFHSIARSPLNFQAASQFIAGGLLLGASGVALAYAVPWWPGLGSLVDRRRHAAAAQVGFRFNGFIALALCERLAGAQGVLLMSLLIGICVPAYNVAAVWPMARDAKRGFLGELMRNPLIIATALGLSANLAGIAIPGWLEPALSRVGASSIPLGLMAAGAGLQFARMMNDKALSAAVLSIRHVILPLIAYGLCAWFALSEPQSRVLMVFSALPAASSSYVLAARMGYDGAYVAGLVTLSTLLAMLSLPFAIGLSH